jgi:hypothetical protein
MTPITRRTVLSLSAAALVLPVGARAASARVKLYKNPQCGCCEDYAAYLRQNGFSVEIIPTNDLASMSRRAGVPEELDGCHISVIDGYVVEGHVPIAAIRKLLAERPKINAITLPGMPEGAPGMAGAKRAPFTVYAVAADGHPSVYLTE